MSREIKFRVWNKRRKFMSSLWQIDWEHNIVMHNKRKPSDLRDAILLQYTGLKDMNGVEIYEGDIVEFNGKYEIKFGGHGVPSIETETYVDNAYGFYFKAQHDLKNINPFGFDIPLNQLYAKDCKVIGNIYENPELLEVQK